MSEESKKIKDNRLKKLKAEKARMVKKLVKKMNTLELLQDDFKLFLQALWAQLDLPSPTRAQYAIADYLQHGPKRLQIQAFRGVGKVMDHWSVRALDSL